MRNDEPYDVRLAHAGQSGDGDAAQSVDSAYDLPNFCFSVVGWKTGLLVDQGHDHLSSITHD